MVGACPIFDFPELILYIQKLMPENEGFYENNAMTYLHKKCGQAQNKYGWSLPSQIYEFHTAAESTSSKTGKKVSSLPYLLPKVFI